MTSDEAYDLPAVGGDEGCARSEGFLREEFSVEIGGDATLPVGVGLPLLAADGRHGGNVGLVGGTNDDEHGSFEFLRITFPRS